MRWPAFEQREKIGRNFPGLEQEGAELRIASAEKSPQQPECKQSQQGVAEHDMNIAVALRFGSHICAAK